MFHCAKCKKSVEPPPYGFIKLRYGTSLILNKFLCLKCLEKVAEFLKIK